MQWIALMNAAMDYIEGHLLDEVNPARAAQIACCSSYHFQRMFSYLAGVPLKTYVRRRRMTLAALDLQSGQRVTDVALKYGYESPTAFNRAFQSVHSLAPSLAKESGARLTAYAPIRFTIVVKGEVAMEYRIEKKPAFRVVGLKATLDSDIEKNFLEVPKLWERVAREGAIPKLLSLMNGEPQGVLGVCGCQEGDSWSYLIAVASDQPAPEGFSEYTVQPYTWAVFPGSGPMPAAIQELERRAVAEWLPASGYEYADGPDIELYLNPDPGDARFEVWMPIRKA